MALAREIHERVPVSVLVISYNEQANIARCLESVSWADEVFVVDACSTDGTVEIAREMGAQVCSHVFEGFAAQRNWALENVPFSHCWVLMLDADERIPQALAQEVAQVVANRNDHAGYYIKRRFFFLGRWLRHGGLYPTWILRLFKRDCARVENRPLNEHVVLTGSAGFLDQPFDHQDQRPLSDWILKHNRYAELEVEEFFQELFWGGYKATIKNRFWGEQAERKRWIKLKVWNRLPLLFRPFLFFLRNYILKGGFIDGSPGFIYHVLWSFWYPFVVSSKIIERKKRPFSEIKAKAFGPTQKVSVAFGDSKHPKAGT